MNYLQTIMKLNSKKFSQIAEDHDELGTMIGLIDDPLGTNGFQLIFEHGILELNDVLETKNLIEVNRFDEL
jgi:hypothetical protein